MKMLFLDFFAIIGIITVLSITVIIGVLLIQLITYQTTGISIYNEIFKERK